MSSINNNVQKELYQALEVADESRLKQIIERYDPSHINLTYRSSTPLAFLITSSTLGGASAEKIIACAQILIHAGAKLNEYQTGSSNNSLLGHVIYKLSRALSAENKEKYKKLTQFFISQGALAYCSDVGGEFTIEDASDSQDKSERANYVRILKEQTVKSNWDKTRELFLGQKDKDSILSELPPEVANLIFQEIVTDQQQ